MPNKYLVWPEPLVLSLFKDLPFSPLNGLGTFVKNLTLYVTVYFWAFFSILLVYIAVFMPVLHCLNYSSFAISFDIKNCQGGV